MSVPGVRVADWAAEAVHVAASEAFEYGEAQQYVGGEVQSAYVATGKVLWGQAKASDRESVVKAFSSNTVVTRVEMVNALVEDGLAQAWSRALCENQTITALNLESNSIGSAGMEALADGLRGNRTLQELKLANQSVNFTQAAEEALAVAVEGSSELTRLTIDLRSTRARGIIDRSLLRNQDQLRLSRLPTYVLEAQAAAHRLEIEQKEALAVEREVEARQAAQKLAEEKAAIECQAKERLAALKASADERAADAARRLATQKEESERAAAEEQDALKAAAVLRRATMIKLEAATGTAEPPVQQPSRLLAGSQNAQPVVVGPPQVQSNGNGTGGQSHSERNGCETGASGSSHAVARGTMPSDAARATLVWAPAAHGGWREARLLGYDSGGAAIVEGLEDQERFTLDAEQLLLQNEQPDGGVDDMTKLEHLHEPGLLHNLRQRFVLGSIYTVRCPVMSPADSSSLVHANHSPLYDFQAPVDTALESSNAVSTRI